MNELDSDLQFIFEELTTNKNFREINLKIINNKLHFHVCHKPAIFLVTLFIKVVTYRLQKAVFIALSLARRTG